MNDELTHLDLCTGLAGFAIAAGRVGFRTIGFSEIDPWCCRFLAERYPGIRNYGDLKNTREFAGLRPRLITAGYPCQPDSLAGKRAGARDDRWIWSSVRDIVKMLGPDFCVFENVLGHVTMGLDQVLSDLECIGYSAQPFIIPACAVDAPHRRERVWIVAYRNSAWEPQQTEGRHKVGDGTVQRSENVPDTDSQRLREQSEPNTGSGHAPRPVDDRTNDAHAQRERPQGFEQARPAAPSAYGPGAGDNPCRWEPEPAICRVVDGLPDRLHRIKALGNSIVWQVAEEILRMIVHLDRQQLYPSSSFG